MKTKLSRGIENKIYGLVLFVAVISFIVFFTSKIWLYDDSEIIQTPFGEKISGLNQTTLVLNKWEYSPKKQLMEVALQTQHTGSDLINPTYSFKAKDLKSNSYYPINIVYKDDNSVILQIKKVPQDYKNVYLYVQENRDKTLLKGEDQDNEMKPSIKMLVGDYREISINNNMTGKNQMDYEKDQVAYQMKQIKSKIAHIQNEQIPLQKEIIKVLNGEISSLQTDMKYQTENEKKETLASIQDKKTSIDNANKKIQTYKESIKELQDKFNKLNEKVDDIISKKKQKEKKTNTKITENKPSVEGNTNDSKES